MEDFSDLGRIWPCVTIESAQTARESDRRANPCPSRHNLQWVAARSRQGYQWGSEPLRSAGELVPVGIDEESCTRNFVPIQPGVARTVVNLHSQFHCHPWAKEDRDYGRYGEVTVMASEHGVTSHGEKRAVQAGW